MVKETSTYPVAVSWNSCSAEYYYLLWTLYYTRTAILLRSIIYFEHYTRTAVCSGSTCHMFTYHSTHVTHIIRILRIYKVPLRDVCDVKSRG